MELSDRRGAQLDGAAIRLKRVSAGLPGNLVARAAKISRSMLSQVERGYVVLPPTEALRIAAAIDNLKFAQIEVRRVAEAAGWPGALPVHA